MPILFHYEEISFRLERKKTLQKWIASVIAKEKKEVGEINYTFCTDDYLLKLNKEHLDHDTLTDIITFDNSAGNTAHADIFISVDRVKENAETFKVPFEKELHRVMIHGVLHLLGYNDKTSAEKTAMRKKEDVCLKKLNDQL
jgi:probable rRNA maturation factor